MTTADPRLKERLSRATSQLAPDVEARLDELHRTARRRRTTRHGATLAVGLAVALLAVFVAWRALPHGSGRTVPRGETGPTGRIALMRITGSGDQADGDLLVADPGTGAVSPLLVNPKYAIFPVWSPDGTHVAYLSDQGGGSSYGLWVSDADGVASIGMNIANTEAGIVALSWSPDGARIAYLGSDNGGRTLHVVNADGTGDAIVLDGQWESVSWSPDGQRLLLTGWPSNPQNTGYNDLYTVRPDGSDLTQLTEDQLWEHYATWSPDGTRIAFSRSKYEDDADPTSEIYVMSADGSGLTQLTDSPGLDFLPVWSPDGRWIAFASVRGATEEQKQAIADGKGFGGISVWLMGADGSDPRMLVDGGPDVVAPTSWAP